MTFQLTSSFQPCGDQPAAIDQLVEHVRSGNKHQVLLGVTGSGKTFTMANIIQRLGMPTLVMSHNKTLAAQLYQEFKEFFPHNAVEYFVSFYDYYQPEAYIPSSDTYIEKSSDINQEIDRLRLKATSSLLSRRDVIIVASVSCIYNIGSPESYLNASTRLTRGQSLNRREFLSSLLEMRYERNDLSFDRGTFRVRGDIIDVYPAYEEHGVRIETFGDEIDRMARIDPLDGKKLDNLEQVTLFPAKHFVSTAVSLEDSLAKIHEEMTEQVALFKAQGKVLEAQRLEQRTLYDIEMLREVGYINGIENYSRILDGREPGSRPYTLLDFFSPPFLTIVDESHASIPQIGGMYNGDRARKETLVEHGFRIPCALDNRPLRFSEFEEMVDTVVYSSATPADYETEKSRGFVVEQLIRPTGLVDPPIEVKPARNQVDDLIGELRTVIQKNERALITTLTKKMAEDLTDYLESLDFRVRYLHSEINTLERPEIIADLRRGEFDIIVGINLLREGLDLPEVSLVAILDADKEGFLRSTRSLIQIAGRAARNINGRIVLYADEVTASIRRALDENTRRRHRQLRHNERHGIIPRSVTSGIKGAVSSYVPAREPTGLPLAAEPRPDYGSTRTPAREPSSARTDASELEELQRRMQEAASKLQFEKAAGLRDRIAELRKES